MQFPVYISDDLYLPWNDELVWPEFCIIIKEKGIPNIDRILRSIDDTTYNRMLENGKKVYEKYFTMDGVVDNIINRI